MSKLIIVVDDERTFHSNTDVTYLRTVPDALMKLVRLWNMDLAVTQVIIDELWLDHDMGDGGDINVLVDWMANISECDARLPVVKIMVHSQNPVGAENICKKLERHYNVRRSLLPELV